MKKFENIQKELLMDKYNWKDINYPSIIHEKNNPKIALNILYANKRKPCLGYKTKLKSVKNKLFLVISNKVGGHYPAVKTYLHY